MPWHIAGIVIFAVFAFTSILSGWIFYRIGHDAGDTEGRNWGHNRGHHEGQTEQKIRMEREAVSAGLAFHEPKDGKFCLKSRIQIAQELLAEVATKPAKSTFTSSS